MSTPYTGEFSLRQVADLRGQLEAKRVKYLGKMNNGDSNPESTTLVWQGGDLSRRLGNDEFCLLYYKYFILCQLLLEAIKDPTGKITEEILRTNYTEAPDRIPDKHIFRQAGEIVHEFIVENLQPAN